MRFDILLFETIHIFFTNSIQFNSLFGHIGPMQSDTHINIDTTEREKNQLICSREYNILRRDYAVHINSTIISI